MLEAEKSCRAAQLQIDKSHLPYRMQMQNLTHNDFDALAIDNKTHDAWEDVA